MFSKSNHDQEEKNRKPVNTFIKKSLSMAALAAMAVSVLWVSGFTTYAKKKLPTGDMRYIPIVEDGGEIEISEEYSGKIQPKGVNAELVTGEHYKYLGSDEKILYEALYKAVSDKVYIQYKDRAKVDDYNFLEKEKKLYAFYTGDKAFNKYYTGKGFSYALSRAAEACYYDHPNQVEFYMVSGEKIYSSEDKDGKVTSYLVFVAKQDDTKFAEYDSKINIALPLIVNAIKDDAGDDKNFNKWDAVKEWWAHDIYCTEFNLDYDHANTKITDFETSYYDYAHTAYGALVERSAVCDGYSAGFEMIMNALGVKTMVITGWGVVPGGGGGHAWNIVQLDGNWYEVDTTWDDNDDPETATKPDGTITHDYFNVTTELFATGINGSDNHYRKADDGFCGYLMPQARGTHWVIDYLKKNEISGLYQADDVVLVSALRIEDNFDLNYGATYEPKVTIFPDTATNKEYMLTSSNPDVVSVEGTTVKGLKIGTATLTATSKDGLISDSCLVTVTVFEGSEFTKSGNTYRITGENTAELIGSTKATVNIHATFKVGTITFKVTGIADNAFKKNKKITTINGGKNLVSIGKNAFRECSKLKNIKLSSAKSLKEIGATAFYKSGKVTTLQLSVDSLKTIGKNALGKINKEAKFTITASSKKKYNKIVKALKKAGAKEATYEKYEKKK